MYPAPEACVAITSAPDVIRAPARPLWEVDTLATSPQPAGSSTTGSAATKAGDAGEAIQKHSYGFFALIALCFLLPFVAVTCSGSELASLQGLDLAIGGEAEVNEEFEQQMEDIGQGFGGQGTVETETTTSDEKVDMNVFALAALIAAVAGAVLMFVLKGRARNLAAILCAVVILAGLILVRFDDQLKVEEQGDFPGGTPITLEYKFGYWLALLLALIVGAIHILALRDKPGSNPIGRSPEPPPPVGGPPTTP